MQNFGCGPSFFCEVFLRNKIKIELFWLFQQYIPRFKSMLLAANSNSIEPHGKMLLVVRLVLHESCVLHFSLQRSLSCLLPLRLVVFYFLLSTHHHHHLLQELLHPSLILWPQQPRNLHSLQVVTVPTVVVVVAGDVFCVSTLATISSCVPNVPEFSMDTVSFLLSSKCHSESSLSYPSNSLFDSID